MRFCVPNAKEPRKALTGCTLGCDVKAVEAFTKCRSVLSGSMISRLLPRLGLAFIYNREISRLPQEETSQPLALLALLRDGGVFRTRILRLLIPGALFVLLTMHNAILSPNAIFFVPVEASSLRAIQVLKQISTDALTQGVLLPVLRTLFSALALLFAASLHTQNGATFKRMATKLRLIDREVAG